MIATAWDSLLAYFNYDQYWISVAGSWLVTTIAFWLLAGNYMIIDTLGWPKWYVKYRIQEDPYPVSRSNVSCDVTNENANERVNERVN